MEVSGSELKTERVDHLGLVVAACRRLGLEDKLNKRLWLKRDVRRIVTPGVGLIALLLNGLGFTTRRLYLTPQFFESKALEELLGEGLEASHFNDDALGRCLDEVVEYGPTRLFGELALEMMVEQDLFGEVAHLDSTSFSVTGSYETSEPSVIDVTYGFSKDHRPDLKQSMLALVCQGEAQVPFWMEPQDGNSSDRGTFGDIAGRVCAFQKEMQQSAEMIWVADAAFYSEPHLQKCQEIFWVSRVPETIKECCNIVKTPSESLAWTKSEGGYRYTELESKYGKISQRWLLVFSEKAYSREQKTFEKKLHRDEEALKALCARLESQDYGCERDARAALNKHVKKNPLFRITGELKVQEGYTKPGRPAVGQKKVVKGYRIAWTVERDQEAIAAQLSTKGRFVLATNQLDQDALPSEKILRSYKEQQSVERGFRFLKDPCFMADQFFVKKQGAFGFSKTPVLWPTSSL